MYAYVCAALCAGTCGLRLLRDAAHLVACIWFVRCFMCWPHHAKAMPYHGAVLRMHANSCKTLSSPLFFPFLTPVFDTKHVFCIINICATTITLSYDCAQLPRVFGSNRCFRMDACGCYYAICRHQRIGGWMMKMLRRGGGLRSSQNAPPDVASVSMQRLRKGIIRRLRCARPAWVGDAAGTSDDLRNFI